MRQLDLFTDSLPVQRTNALIDALCRLDGAVARQALYSLASIDPKNAKFPHFQRLCASVHNWPISGWPRGPSVLADTMRLIEEQIAPVVKT